MTPTSLTPSRTTLIDSAWAAVAQLPRKLRARVRAVGLAGQMHGVVLLDGRGAPLTPLITWQDRRVLEPGFLESLRERTGHRLHSGFGGATLAWLRRHGAWPGDAAPVATIHDLAAARLCELARPPTDPTDAASWGLFDFEALDWDRAAVAAAGIPTDVMPTVVPSGARIGAMTDAMAGRMGIPAGVPVVAALGDNQASLVAVLREPDRELVLTLGTGGALRHQGAKADIRRRDAPLDAVERGQQVDKEIRQLLQALRGRQGKTTPNVQRSTSSRHRIQAR